MKDYTSITHLSEHIEKICINAHDPWKPRPHFFLFAQSPLFIVYSAQARWWTESGNAREAVSSQQSMVNRLKSSTILTKKHAQTIFATICWISLIKSQPSRINRSRAMHKCQKIQKIPIGDRPGVRNPKHKNPIISKTNFAILLKFAVWASQRIF